VRDRDPDPTARTGRSRAALVLGLLVAIEAVAIVFLVMTRASEAERAPTLRAPTEQAAPVVPAFSPPSVDHEREAARSTELGAPPKTEPQPLSAPRADTAAVGLVLCGTVTVDDGRPLGECTVEVDEGPIEAHVPVNQGTYSVAGLEPGLCTVSCSADGCLSRPVQVALDASRPIERLDLRLERLPVIPVRIRTPDGRSLLELFDEARLPGRLRPSVTLQAPSPLAPFGEEVSANWTDLVHGLADSPGEVELKAAGWDGVLRVRVPLPVYVNLMWEQRVLATEAVTAPGAGATFTVDLDALLRELCTVRARVVDFDSGLPVDGALAELDKVYLRGDASGVFVFERVTPGPNVLHIHPPGAWMGISDSLVLSGANQATHSDANIAIDPKAGEPLDLGDLRLLRTVQVRGRVTDAAGQPLDTVVTATRVDVDTESKSRSSRLVVQPNGNDGTFSVRVVPGRWSFSPSSDAQAPGAKLLDIRGDIEGVNLIGVRPLTK
jgi:hypothetical protein